MEIRKAQKSKSRLRIGVAGSSGSGKTYSALLMAKGLAGDWNKVCVIDTENGSADLYDHLGEYNVLTLTAPFTPERYIEAIKAAEKAGMEVILIDSMTHEWDGRGGILEMIDQTVGNSFTAWGKMTPRHNRFIDAILGSTAHVICTLRTKQDYVLVDKNGKKVPEKVGLKMITREGVDYEFTLVFDLTIKHLASSSKDRTGIFTDKPEFLMTEETGEIIKAWGETGVDAEQIAKDLADKKIQEQVEKANKYKQEKKDALNRIVELLIKKGKEEFSLLEQYKKNSLEELALNVLEAAIEKLETFPDVEVQEIDIDPDEVEAGIQAQAKK